MAPSKDQALQALGELIITGFNGPELSDETASFLTQARIGGVWISSQNYESPAQLAELSNDIQAKCGAGPQKLPLWIGVDHEGGRLQRFKKGFTKIPEAAAIAATDSPRLAFEIAELMAQELEAVGVNLNFAPVVDIATNARNPLIGPRAFGSDEETVSKMASGLMRGHLVNGVQPCIKHFPGHGDTATDSHFSLPRVDTPIEVLREREFKPFVKAIRGRCAMVMTAHLISSALDPDLPATLSPKVIRDVLRGELRYSRVVVTDEMEMKAITDHFSPSDAALMAIEAGCDILLYRTEAGARHAYDTLLEALNTGKLSPERVIESAQRIRAVKNDVLVPYQPVDIAGVGEIVGIEAHAELVAKVPELSSKK